MNLIVGTAGHIDHGKTALVKALTGVDADRLPEEKRRGITVDLGFAEMSVGDMHLGFVDVPGHERFVKNMLAGASGVDLVLMVVAADEGVMPQTREHFEICRLLGIGHGIVALTKTDLIDAETLELARMEIAELVAGSFLEGSPVIGVSVRTGDGLEELKAELIAAGGSIVRGDNDVIARLPIDRSFSVKGFGAVATGTLASGEINEGRELELLPGGKKIRVRGLQTHGNSVTRAAYGQRVAVNLGGIDHSRVTRGMTLAEPDVLQPTQIMDVHVEVLKSAPRPLRTRQRVRLHIGTVEALARIQIIDAAGEIAPGSTGLAQIRLEAPVVAVPGERFIIRSYSPQATIAGGEVIDPLAVKHRRRDLDAFRGRLEQLIAAKGDHVQTLNILISAAGSSGMNFRQLQTRTALRPEVLRSAIGSVVADGAVVDTNGFYIATSALEKLTASLAETLAAFHKREPLARGMPREQVRDTLFSFVPNEAFLSALDSLRAAGTMVVEKDIVRLATHSTELSPAEASFKKKLAHRYTSAGLEVPKLDEAMSEAGTDTQVDPQKARRLLQMLLDSGEVVKVSDEFYFAAASITGLIAKLRRHAAESGDRVVGVPKFKEIAGVSRKYAIPLLEYLDREHVTARAGDKRVIL